MEVRRMEENKYNNYLIHRMEGLEDLKIGLISRIEVGENVYFFYKDNTVRLSIPVQNVDYIELI